MGAERNIVERAASPGRGSQDIAVSARDCDRHRTANFGGTIRPLANAGLSLVCPEVPNPSRSFPDPSLACLPWGDKQNVGAEESVVRSVMCPRGTARRATQQAVTIATIVARQNSVGFSIISYRA